MCMYMIFRSGTCANWAQVNASTSLEGEGGVEGKLMRKEGLKGDEEVVVERYKWSGNNRKHLYRKAVRGSGGVGVLIREEVLNTTK